MRYGLDKYFVMRRKTGLWIYEVQVKENYRQSGHQKVWDMVLSIIGKIKLNWQNALDGCFRVWLS